MFEKNHRAVPARRRRDHARGVASGLFLLALLGLLTVGPFVLSARIDVPLLAALQKVVLGVGLLYVSGMALILR